MVAARKGDDERDDKKGLERPSEHKIGIIEFFFAKRAALRLRAFAKEFHVRKAKEEEVKRNKEL